MNGPSAADALLSLALPSSSAERPFDVAQIDVVAERRADDPAAALGNHGDLRLGIVPGRDRVQPDIGAEPDRRHRLALGEDLRVRADADFEILRPGAARDQLGLDLHRLCRSRASAWRDRVPISPAISARMASAFSAEPRACSSMTRSSRLTDEGDAGSLHRLQVDGRKQIGLRRIAAVCEAVGGDQRRQCQSPCPWQRRHSRPASSSSQTSRTVGASLDVMSTISLPRTVTTSGCAIPVVRARPRNMPSAGRLGLIRVISGFPVVVGGLRSARANDRGCNHIVSAISGRGL